MGLGPLPAVPNVLRVSIRGMVGTRPWANILHFLWGGSSPGTAGCSLVATAVASALTGNLLAYMDTSTSFTQIEVTDLTSDTAGQYTLDIVGDGTRDGDYLPASASALVTYAVSKRYRGGHPRTYLSVGVFADLTSPNTWGSTFTSTLYTAWQNVLAAIIENYGAFTISELVAVQYVHIDKTLVPPAEVYNDPPIVLALDPTNMTVETVLGTQRRRIRKR